MQSSSVSKQVLLLANRVVSGYHVEAVGKDPSYSPPIGLQAGTMSKTALFLFTEPVTTFDFTLEAVASHYVPAPSAIAGRSIGATSLLLANAVLRNYQLEAVGADSSFRKPGEIRTRSVSATALVLSPLGATTRSYLIEAVGYGVTPTPSSRFILEAVSGLPYNTPIHGFTLEAVGESTISPPRDQTQIIWFTVGDP